MQLERETYGSKLLAIHEEQAVSRRGSTEQGMGASQTEMEAARRLPRSAKESLGDNELPAARLSTHHRELERARHELVPSQQQRQKETATLVSEMEAKPHHFLSETAGNPHRTG